jgi:hypothetical protein
MNRREQLTRKDKIKILTLLSAGVPVYEIQKRYKLKSAESVYRIKRMTIADLEN